MPRKYKMPRVFKSEETYQKWIEGKRKGGRIGGVVATRLKWHPETMVDK